MARSDTKRRKDVPAPKYQNKTFIVGAIVALTFIAFSNILNNGFITNWDDNSYILNNPQVKDLSFHGLKDIFSTFQIGNYHPLTMLGYALEYKLFGFSAKGFHFVNLLFHLINVVLVFKLILLLSKRIETATITTVLFAIHPMHVESVTWISELKDVLFSFFFLLSLISYINFSETTVKKKYVYSILFFIGSLLSKPAAIVLPFILVLIDFYQSKKINKKSLLEKLPFLILGIGFGLIAMYSQSSSGATDIAPVYSIFERVFISSYALIMYLIKLVLPINLSAMYGYPIKDGSLLPITYLLSPLLIVGLIILIWKNTSIRKDLIFGFGFFIITIALVLQIIPFGRAMIAERYTYIPYIGLFYIIGQSYSKLEESSKTKTYFKYALFAVVLVFSVLTWQRNKIWKDGYVLFSDVIKKDPTVGYAYYARGEFKEDIRDYRGAVEDFTESLKTMPNFMAAYLNRGVIKHYINDNVGAIADINKAIELDPKNPPLYMNRGICKLSLNLRSEACDDFKYAASLGFNEAYGMIQKTCN